MLRMTMDDFERCVEEALAEIPENLRALMENVVVVVEDEPEDDLLRDMGLDPARDTIFGLYEGISLPERGADYGGALPDRIIIYRIPLLEECGSRRELRREIRDTVIHEVGHYFGFDEEDLP